MSKVRMALTALPFVVTATLAAKYLWPPTTVGPITRDALTAGFDAGIGHVVIAWDPTDRRPASERRRSLFDFMYQTFDASAWIPQSLFDSDLVTQAVVGDVDTIVGDQIGLVRWRENPRVPAFGMAPNAQGAAHEPLKWTVNCLVCHTAEIDGVVYLGAGTKTFDEVWLGEALKRLTSEPWRRVRLGRHSAADEVAADAHRILSSHHHDKLDSLTRARSTAFAASHVELYMRAHQTQMPAVDEVGRGDVKTPPLWHTAAKLPVGRWYTDGSFHGPLPLMASSMELKKDRSFDALAETVIPTIKEEFASVIRHLRPPPYPYAIDARLAAQGRELFYSGDLACYHCHGVYDGHGHVGWPGVHVPIGTDRSRIDLVSGPFIDAFNRSPLAREGALQQSRGYAATPLTGVWANFPYLHNGSVPTLHDLLGPASERPKIFEVRAARQLDRVRVGQPLYRDARVAQLGEVELLRQFGEDRNWFNTARPGCSNRGHDFWRQIKTDANRRALIEYLKTL